MELKGFLQVLYNRRWLLLSIISVTLIASYLIASQSPPIYQAQVRIVAGITNGEHSLFSLGETKGLERYEVEARFRNMEELIRSPKVISLTSYQLMKHELTDLAPFRDLTAFKQAYTNDELRIALRNFATKRDSMATLKSSDELEQLHLKMIKTLGYDVESIKSNLDVRRVPGTDYISIGYKSDKAELSAFVVNQIAREFIRVYLLTNSEILENSLATLEELVVERRVILDEKLKSWNRYNQQQSLESSTGGLELLQEIEALEKAREETDRQILTSERRIVEAKQGLPKSRGEEDVLPTEGVGEATLLKSKLLRLNDRYIRSGLQQRDLLDSIQSVKRLLVGALSIQEKRNLEESSQEVDQLITSWKEGEVDLFIYQARLTAIAQQLRRLASQAGTFSNPQLTATTYGREVEIARDAYLTALKRINDAKLGLNPNGTGTVSIMEFAQAPEKPEPSKAFLIAALAGLISLCIAMGVLLLLEYLDESIKLPSRFSAMAGLPLMGSLIRLKSSNVDLVTLFHSSQKNTQLETYKKQLRILRHEIALADPVTLMVTSTRAGAGKSSLLISLAYSLSLSEKKVLMVDTNLANASLTAMTGASPTLQKYLKGTLPMESLISPSVFDNVDVIGCAQSQSSPAEAFPHELFEQLLVRLSDNYDHILMEGAALNEYVDARELLMYSARILPVFAADAPVQEADLQSIAFLKKHADKVMGAVLNKVEIRHLSH